MVFTRIKRIKRKGGGYYEYPYQQKSVWENGRVRSIHLGRADGKKKRGFLGIDWRATFSKDPNYVDERAMLEAVERKEREAKEAKEREFNQAKFLEDTRKATEEE